MKFISALIVASLMLAVVPVKAVAPPDQVATVFVHGFDATGAGSDGVVGDDFSLDYVSTFAAAVGLPDALVDPTAPNQVAVTTYYGSTYPSYYSADDIAEVEAVTALHGGGVPRYAHIVAKHAKEVLRRSGASQINLVGLSFGGLVSRYILENDIEGLASGGNIARWLAIEGVVQGHYGATYGGPLVTIFLDQTGGDPVDVDHMDYAWVRDNVHDPRDTSSAPWLANIPVYFWRAADDNLYGKTMTQFFNRPNDGVVFLEDMVLTLPPALQYAGMPPAVTTLHTNHNTMSSQPGLYAGVFAALTGRARATITLEDVTLKTATDSDDTEEVVFGVGVYSLLAETVGMTDAIADLRAEDASLPYYELEVGLDQSINLTWFDAMLLPGETQLRLETNVEELDGDRMYGVSETSGDVRQALANETILVDVTKDGQYQVDTADWSGTVRVQLTQYPAFNTGVSAARDWALYY